MGKKSIVWIASIVVLVVICWMSYAVVSVYRTTSPNHDPNWLGVHDSYPMTGTLVHYNDQREMWVVVWPDQEFTEERLSPNYNVNDTITYKGCAFTRCIIGENIRFGDIEISYVLKQKFSEATHANYGELIVAILILSGALLTLLITLRSKLLSDKT